MANNYIYRFAENATGSNILSDAAFQSDTDRPIGHQPGIARQELENKALRSYSAISTAVAQFMANNQSTDVHDALTTTQLNSIFEAAITAAASSGPGRSLTGVTFASGVSDGDVVRYDSTNNQYVAAIADGTGNDNAVGVADATNGAVFIYGRASLFSGLSAGEPYYLSTATAGAVTSTRPSSDAVSVGIAVSATDMMIGVEHLGVSAQYLRQSLGFELVAGSGPKPSKSAIIGGVAMRQAYSIPAGFTGSEARALTAFTAAATFNVNAYPSGSTTATNIGTVNFAAGATAGTFSSSAAYSGAAGDMLTVEAPATQDSTGAGIGITIHGTYA